MEDRMAESLEGYLEVLEEGYYEVKFAFEGLADENVWKRPAEGLLSVGELAGHIAFWEAVKLAPEGPQDESETPRSQISSPLVDPRFRYYQPTLASLPSEEQRAMTADQVCAELLRVHEEAVSHFKTLAPDPDTPVPAHIPYMRTYGPMMRYMAFHIAYHTGQMFSVRHLLREQTPDN
jgi:hypothetical protein